MFRKRKPTLSIDATNDAGLPFSESIADSGALPGDALEGDARRFGREDSLEEQWRIVEPLLGGDVPHVHLYDRGTMGPIEADALADAHGVWHDPLLPESSGLAAPPLPPT